MHIYTHNVYIYIYPSEILDNVVNPIANHLSNQPLCKGSLRPFQRTGYIIYPITSLNWDSS